MTIEDNILSPFKIEIDENNLKYDSHFRMYKNNKIYTVKGYFKYVDLRISLRQIKTINYLIRNELETTLKVNIKTPLERIINFIKDRIPNQK